MESYVTAHDVTLLVFGALCGMAMLSISVLAAFAYYSNKKSIWRP